MYGWNPEFATPVAAVVNIAFCSLLLHEFTDDKGELAIELIGGPDITPLAVAGDIPKPDDVVDIVKTLWFDDGSMLLDDDRSNP